MAVVDVDQRIRDLQREYLDFLDDDNDQGTYTHLVRDMITRNGKRLIVNINDLRKKNKKRCQNLLSSSMEEMLAFQRALKEFVASSDSTYAKNIEEFLIGLEGSFGSKHVTPRTLVASYLGNIVCVEGIVTKCSLVRPKIIRSVHYCPATQKSIERRYSDFTSYDPHPSNSAYPTKDEDGNLLETEYGLSVYKDHQTFSIQEMPEKSPAGQLPRTVDIIAESDMVDQCKPGDRVQVVGTFRCLPNKRMGYTTCTFKTIMIANNVQLLSKEVTPHISVDDVRKCKQFSRQKGDVFEILARSLAPSIHGHEFIKKAVLCLLLGGVEKVLPNGTRLRGDINVLLLGDPSVAKSQLLRYVLHTAPRAIPTTGRGSSGVGLTAAVTTDMETGDRRLEAGAMVLADRGIVCIDEFDKMSDIDRTAIHEVMEQGRVTIAKAGIHAKLNARCSVLAAANPVYGKYDQYKTPMENIGLQDSLLSRFDLLFIMLDKMDPESDREIADHVVRIHRYRGVGEMDGEPLPIHSTADFLTTKDVDADEEQETSTPIFEKFDALLHGPKARKEKIVSMQFMKKYIHIAKVLKPTLTKEACECIAEEYSRLRSMDTEHTDLARTQPVTARSLETLIRLSTAHAKARMSRTVDLQDANAAIELVQFAYFKKVIEKPKKRQRRNDDDSDDSSVDGDDGEDKNKKKKKKRSTPRPKPGEEGYDPYAFDEDEDGENADMDVDGQSSAGPSGESSAPLTGESSAGPSAKSTQSSEEQSTLETISDDRLKRFRALLLRLFKEQHSQSVPVPDLTEFITEQAIADPFTPEEIRISLDKMMDANQVMVADNVVFLI